MAEPEPEGWGVPAVRAMRVLVAVPAFLLAMLGLAFWFYHGHLKPARIQPLMPFPAPGIETYVHPGRGDPEVPAPRPARSPRVDAAMRAVAAKGLPGWPVAGRPR